VVFLVRNIHARPGVTHFLLMHSLSNVHALRCRGNAGQMAASTAAMASKASLKSLEVISSTLFLLLSCCS
jgi:hypothetical protein